jgi:CheY-like chemotaxis protein
MSLVRRVLIADDNPDVRKMICRIFEPEKAFELCAEAVNGEHAVALARQYLPDLIILDLSMPIMNGMEAARVIHQEMAHVPIILYTLYSNAIPAAEAAAYGIKRVVPKIEIENLVKHAQAVFQVA